MGYTVLTVIDAFPSLPAVPVEEPYPGDDGGELSELLLLVAPEEGHEGPQLRLGNTLWRAAGERRGGSSFITRSHDLYHSERLTLNLPSVINLK